MIKVMPPISLGTIPRDQLNTFRHVVNKVVCAATIDGMGADIMLRVYLAGLYHGTLAANGWTMPQSTTEKPHGR
jgi:hypothetical protein